MNFTEALQMSANLTAIVLGVLTVFETFSVPPNKKMLYLTSKQ